MAFKSAAGSKKKTATKKTAAKRGRKPVVAEEETAPKKRGRPAKKTAAKRTPTPRGSKKTPAKRTTGRKSAASKNVKNVKKPAAKRTPPPPREVDEVTGFVEGTDQHIIALALIEGAETRQDIIDEMRDTLDTETRNGTEKPIANLVSAVVRKLEDRGFTLDSHYALVPPTKSVKGKKRK